jgi:anti-sigma B factor antagonist
MKLTLGIDDGQTVRVAVTGEITQKTVSPLEEPLAELLGPDCYTRQVCLDMSEAPYLDSSGIGWLLKCHKQFRQSGGKLILHSPQPLVANTFRVLNLEKVFHLGPAPTGANPKGVTA